MELTEEQKQKVAEWVSQGLNLSQIQEKLTEAYGVSLTYLDVRFLIDDLNLDLPEAKSRAPADDSISAKSAEPSEVHEAASPADLEPVGTNGGVSVEIDRITKPGAVVSGKVTFSDGKTTDWALDQSGRLMLQGGEPGYQPPADDLQAFQQELSRQLQKQGL